MYFYSGLTRAEGRANWSGGSKVDKCRNICSILGGGGCQKRLGTKWFVGYEVIGLGGPLDFLGVRSEKLGTNRWLKLEVLSVLAGTKWSAGVVWENFVGYELFNGYEVIGPRWSPWFYRGTKWKIGYKLICFVWYQEFWRIRTHQQGWYRKILSGTNCFGGTNCIGVGGPPENLVKSS